MHRSWKSARTISGDRMRCNELVRVLSRGQGSNFDAFEAQMLLLSST